MEELKDQIVLKHEDGILEHDGKKYIVKESYDAVATEARKRKDALEKIEADKKAEDEKKLAEQGEYQKLLEAEKQKNAELLKSQAEAAKRSALKEAATKMGAANADTIARLVDFDKIEVDENGAVKADSLNTLLEGVKTSDPYLFTSQNTSQGGNAGAGAPDNGGTQKATYKRSQLRDAAFYQANREDIVLAQKEGRIEDDIQ